MAVRKSYSKKITTAVCGITPKLCNSLIEQYPDSKIRVLRVYGKINKYEVGTSPINGAPYQKYMGEFEAVNIQTKEKIRSSHLIVPDVASMFLQEGFNGAKAQDPNAQFAFGMDIGVEKNPSNKGGNLFKFCVFPLTEVGPTKDGLDLLGEQLGELPDLLPSPEEAGKVNSDSGKKAAKK